MSAVPRGSWVALGVTWMIWVINAFDREVILRLGPVITDHFKLSPETWGGITALIMFSLAVMAIPGARWSDRFGVGWRRAVFQVPLVIGYNLLSAITGIRVVAHNFVAFVALRLGVNLGAGWGEPIGISNTTEWWPKERHGFALGVHHTGYPVGALFSGLAVAGVLSVFGEDRWSYVFFLGLIVALPVMLFWRWYSTSDRIQRTYVSMQEANLTVPLDTKEEESRADEAGTLKRVLLNRGVLLTSGTTLLTQVVYMGINYVLPLYIANIVGLSFSGAASLSIVFTITGIFGQVLWPSISDYIGRRTTIMICGVWMAIGVGAFYFAGSMAAYVGIQLFFGLVANAVWPIYYAAASDSAPVGAHSTANGVITTAMFCGGGLAPLLMGGIIGLGGGWHSIAGYNTSFLFMAGCALLGVLCQVFNRTHRAAAA